MGWNQLLSMSQFPAFNSSHSTAFYGSNAALLDQRGKPLDIADTIYRFVQHDNYTSNFGFQWNLFPSTQVDKRSNIELSKRRFFAQTKWDQEDLSKKNVLEIGSGAGRFTQVLLDHTKANVHSVDFSNAVEANLQNNGPHERLHLYQASVYDLPFAPGQFDKVFCFGVIQHTPDPQRTVQCLIDMLKPGAELVVDFYPIRGWWTKIHIKYILRPFTKKMSHKRLHTLIEKNADWLIQLNRFFSRAGLGFFNRFVPICDIDGTLPAGLNAAQLREMVVLDTFDMFSPQYDQPQRISNVMKWFSANGMTDLWGGDVFEGKFRAAVVKGKKPNS